VDNPLILGELVGMTEEEIIKLTEQGVL